MDAVIGTEGGGPGPSGKARHIGAVPASEDVEIVFHAANIQEMWQRDVSIFDHVNRIGTRNILKATKTAGVRR